MSERKLFLYSAIVSIACSVCLISIFSFFDKSIEIEQLRTKFSVPVFLSDRQVMNAEMANILLPFLQKQRDEEKTRGKIKAPDTVYAPEQLQQSRGY